MEKKEYLNEENYQRSNKKLKTIGKILLIVGIVIMVISFILIVLSFMGFGNTTISSIGNESFSNGAMQKTASGILGSFGLFALGGFMSTTGFSLAAVGGVIMAIAHKREIAAYTTQQMMPIAQEGMEKMAPTIGKVGKEITKEMAPAYGDIAREISKGIKEGLQDEEK